MRFQMHALASAVACLLAASAAHAERFTLHPNIRFVLSGHLTQTALRQTPGDSGKPVYQILTGYQNDGNGWLRTLEIDPEAKTVKSEAYSPYLEQSKAGPTEQFTAARLYFAWRRV